MRLFITFIFTLIALQSFAQSDSITINQTDGPYVFHTDNKLKVIRTSVDGISVDYQTQDTPIWVKSNDEVHKFELKLHTVNRPQWKYKQPDKMLIISDPHANLDAFLSVLKSQEVINENYKWIFGKGHLVVIGDVFDRGEDVLPIFWLIYKLEDEARKAGGDVHFILGNHEEMILRNNTKYAKDKYKNLADKLDIDLNDMWNSDSELGHWLLTRNTIEQIGDNLFVHAGLSKEFLDQNWSVVELNDTISTYINKSKDERKISNAATFLFGNDGPLWYRGMVRDDEKYNPIAEEDVDAILKRYKVKRIYVGHTIFDEVSTFYNTKVIGVNVNNQKNMDKGLSRGILVKKGKRYIIFDDPQKLIELE